MFFNRTDRTRVDRAIDEFYWLSERHCVRARLANDNETQYSRASCLVGAALPIERDTLHNRPPRSSVLFHMNTNENTTVHDFVFVFRIVANLRETSSNNRRTSRTRVEKFWDDSSRTRRLPLSRGFTFPVRTTSERKTARESER